MEYPFFALLHRMRLIKRWSLMRCLSEENIAEHSFDTAVIAYTLAVIRLRRFSEKYEVCPQPYEVMAAAIFHDASEIITGDLPTPVKYRNPELRDSFKTLESDAVSCLLGMLPEDLSEDFAHLLHENVSNSEGFEIKRLVKAADKLSALLKCMQETSQGNNEFKAAGKKIKDELENMQLPEVDSFISEFAPAYLLNLDELTKDFM